MSSPLARLRVRLTLVLGAAEIHLRLRLPRLMWALTRRPAVRESPFAELDAALHDQIATRTAVVEEIEVAAERLKALTRLGDHGRAA
ncbi:hypothetical protein ACOZFM_35125 [Streptomyces arboris]|uniref:hypothetical protein n=1 Tax=Streptomyces arboris TaxID=2600619 RepID=UPI003BF4F8F6